VPKVPYVPGIVRAVVVIVVAVLAGGQGATAQQPDRATVLRAAADALGMVRWSDIGAGTTRLPGIDVVNTMEFWANGTVDVGGTAVRTEYHAAIGYNPAAMRVELTAGGKRQGPLQTVRDTFAWDESELGAGLVPGKGTATPVMGAVRERLLHLWTLPYGVVKAALAAGDKTTAAMEAGATVITFPLIGALAGVTVKATLDSNNLITRVETRAENAALTTVTEYSNYADRAEVLTDIRSPGRIVRKQGTRTVMDLEVKMWETNNLYLVFPVPANVKAAAPANSR
jgi:hypothetical protein